MVTFQVALLFGAIRTKLTLISWFFPTFLSLVLIQVVAVFILPSADADVNSPWKTCLDFVVACCDEKFGELNSGFLEDRKISYKVQERFSLIPTTKLNLLL